MKRNWTQVELERHWTVSRDDHQDIGNKLPVRKLGIVVLSKYLLYEGRFPRDHRDIPSLVVTYVAEQLALNPSIFRKYKLTGRRCEADRQSIRSRLKWRTATSDDRPRLAEWLRQNVLSDEISVDRITERVIEWFKEQRIEPFAEGHLARMIASSISRHEAELFRRMADALSSEGRASLDRLLVPRDEHHSPTEPAAVDLNDLKADPGRVGVESLFKQIAKLRRINELGLTAEMFQGISAKNLDILRRRVATDTPSRLRTRTDHARWAQVAAYCWLRRREVIDGLVDLLIQIIHRIGKRAENKVDAQLLTEVRKVRGKMQIFARLVDTSIKFPKGVIEDQIYPVVGLDILKALAAEFQSSGSSYREMVRVIMLSSYSKHFRRILPVILDNLVFRTSNPKCEPVLDALTFLRQHRSSQSRYFPPSAEPPLDGVVAEKWQDALYEEEPPGKKRVVRVTYEIGVLQSLRDGLRTKAIWVEGADRFRNPDEDLPQDFDVKREAYYGELDLPKNPEDFTKELRKLMADGLRRLDRGMPTNDTVRILQRGSNGHISITPLEPQEEPENIAALKTEIARRWPSTNLLDVLKETELRLNICDGFTSAGTYERIEPAERQRRLILCLYAMGTNAGIRRILSAEEALSYTELLHTRRRYLDKVALRNAIARVANATFAVRRKEIWGEGTTACGSDSKKFGAWDQNLMTEWHIRYGGRGVMIYWHVDKKSVCIYSQLKRCSSSEVAAMIEGVLRHCTDMEVEKNYVDSHGQSEVAFAFSRLLGFELLPRLKAIKAQRLYLPEAGDAKRYGHLANILTRPIQWDVIHQQYDEMVRYATALRLGTADSEAILRRFTRYGLQHPTYRALSELGKAMKTIFLCNYLHSEPLRREIHEGLNVVENWNSTNSFIFYGKGGEVATNRLDEQELSVLCLHLLQLSLVYINTLMIQNVLREQAWWRKMGERELRALSPLIYSHVNPYGRFELDMDSRMVI